MTNTRPTSTAADGQSTIDQPSCEVLRRASDGRSTMDDAAVDRVCAELAAVKSELSVLRKELVVVRQAVGVLLSRRS